MSRPDPVTAPPPHGHPTRTPHPEADAPTPTPTRKLDRGVRRENETADTLARNGYDIEQNPPTKTNGKNPDYKIDGKYFDCYAPDSDNLDQIRKTLSRKVGDGQADRIVLNLDDCPRSPSEIEDVLRRKPIAGLKEIIVVNNGQVTPFYPFPT